MLSVNCDQANGFDQSLALIGGKVIKQCLYFGLLLGDFTFGCHYERSGQCVVAPYPSSGIGRIIRDIQLSEENLKKYRYERLSEIFPRIM